MRFRHWLIGSVLILNLARFIATDRSPPGFYVDEAVGAAHALCLGETGKDLFGNTLPLFSAGLGAGYYTAPYLFGEALWTRIFGTSTGAFRTFPAFVTCLTILFLFLWVRKKRDEETAWTAALLASVSPWVFQFSRIAWDPPVSVFFIVLGLYCFQGLRWRYHWVAGAIAFGLASMAYPGTRILTLPLVLLLPGLEWRKKSYSMAILLAVLAPVFWRTWTDPRFTARAEMLVLWSSHPMSPLHDASALEIFWNLILNGLKHLSPDFLLISGDQNLRHSTREVGMMSTPEYVLLVGGLIAITLKLIRKKLIPDSQTLFLIAGAGLGIAPAALTWESVPHGLRAIAAWPFFTVLAALAFTGLVRWVPLIRSYLLLFCLAFVSFFGTVYFGSWTQESKPWFQTENNTLGLAYSRLTNGSITCEELAEEIKLGPFRNLK
jgi:hypothetical protein